MDSNENLNPQEQKIADEKEFYRRRALFEPMVQTEAWKEFMKISLAQTSSMTRNALAPPAPDRDGINNVLVSEFHKGVVFGIQLTMKTVYDTISAAIDIKKSEVNRQTKETENAQRDERFDSDGHELPDGAVVSDLGGRAD